MISKMLMDILTLTLDIDEIRCLNNGLTPPPLLANANVDTFLFLGGPSLSAPKFKSSFQRIECFQRTFRLGCSECRSFPGARDIYYFIQNSPKILKHQFGQMVSSWLKLYWKPSLYWITINKRKTKKTFQCISWCCKSHIRAVTILAQCIIRDLYSLFISFENKCVECVCIIRDTTNCQRQ